MLKFLESSSQHLECIHDGKQPDGTTLIPWAKAKPLAMNVTLPDTYANSHIHDIYIQAGAATDQAATKQMHQVQDFEKHEHVSYFQSPYKQEVHGMKVPLNSYKRLENASASLLKTHERQLSCFNVYTRPYKGEM